MISVFLMIGLLISGHQLSLEVANKCWMVIRANALEPWWESLKPYIPSIRAADNLVILDSVNWMDAVENFIPLIMVQA